MEALSTLPRQPPNCSPNLSLTKEEGQAVAKAARSLLVHVSNCDGLEHILTERLSQDKLNELGQRYAQARAQGVPLLRWADTIRKG